MILPSKELLSEVLGCNIKDIYKINSNPNFGNNELVYSISGVGDILSINTYELAHKCKEWAFDKGFVLKSYKKQGAFSGTYHYAIDINDKICEWLANTEYEAIFKACEWIMEQTKCGS